MKVSLVIPGQNVAKTITECLESVVSILGRHGLEEIIFVDDGSVDATPHIVQHYPVRYIQEEAKGPGAARNKGWRSAKGDLIWFIDADCVATADALSNLLVHMEDSQVAGAGGSYANACPESLLACLIHEEIIERHLHMGAEVDHLGSFNVLYRRSVLEEMNGFDESLFNGPGAPGCEDMELSYRISAAGYRLAFERRSQVSHFHPTRLWSYLRAQRDHGYWRARLTWNYPHKAIGDSYSGLIDNSQPPLAVLILSLCPFVLLWPIQGGGFFLSACCMLAAFQIPMAARLIRRTGTLSYAAYGPMGFVRAFARALGLTTGIISAFFPRPK